MKKLILFSSLFVGTFLFSQTDYSSVSQLPDYAILKKRMKLDDVVTKADTPAEFPGGMDNFRRQFADKMDIIDVKSKSIDTRVYFIVEKTGYIRSVAATGSDKKHSDAAEAAVRRLFVKWKPATINGEPVRYLYTFPLTLKKH
ncbi:MAG: energy transducer TonB [Chryseobacterium sp.]